MASEKSNAGCNIVLFPFMAQGHLNPFLDLTRLLASRHPSLTLTLVSTHATLLTLRPVFPASAYPSVQFAELPFNPSDHGLPHDNTHSLADRSLISRLYHSSQTLQPHFHRLISGLSLTTICIISDMFLAWTAEVARHFGIFHAVLYTSGPFAMSIYNSIWTHLPHTLANSDDDHHYLTLPDLPGITIQRSQLSANMKSALSAEHPGAAFVRRQADLCRLSDGTLWNTVEVLEKPFLEMWAESTGKPTWGIGPLFSYALSSTPSDRQRGANDADPGIDPSACLAWLDRHPPRSVVYVSFGSQNSMPAAQIVELALGLEMSGSPFFWVIRPPTGFDVGEDGFKWLPEGFEDRVRESGRGMLVRRWAPQLEILAHRSTGAFLSHCGWNSVLESIWYGVPVIGWPLGSEQFYNSKLMVEKLGVCVEVGRGVEAVVGKEQVARVLGMVSEGEKGREMREAAAQLRREMERAVAEEGPGGEGKGSSLKALGEFVGTIMTRGGRVGCNYTENALVK